MKDTQYLCRTAKRAGIPIISYPLPHTGSLSYQDAGYRCYIGMDKSQMETEADYKVHLAHELGHCMTGSFYNIHAAREIREKHEIRADKWAIHRLISAKDLDHAVAMGYTDLWSLAEYFGVTEDFMRKTVCWYTHGNLSEELDF